MRGVLARAPRRCVRRSFLAQVGQGAAAVARLNRAAMPRKERMVRQRMMLIGVMHSMIITACGHTTRSAAEPLSSSGVGAAEPPLSLLPSPLFEAALGGAVLRTACLWTMMMLIGVMHSMIITACRHATRSAVRPPPSSDIHAVEPLPLLLSPLFETTALGGAVLWTA